MGNRAKGREGAVREIAHSVRYLGIGYHQIWVFMVVMGLSVASSGQQVVGETWLRMMMSGGLTLALVAGMFVEYHLDVLRKGRWVLSLAGCLAAMGTLAMRQALTVYGSVFWCVVGIVCVSLGNAVILLSWIEHLALVPREEQLRFTLTAWPFAAAAVPLLLMLPETVSFLVACAMPVASSLTLILCSQDHDAPTQGLFFRMDRGSTWKAPHTRLLFACLALSFAFGCARTFPQVTQAMGGSIWVYWLVALVFLAVPVLARIGSDGRGLAIRIYRLCFPAMIIGFLAAPFSEGLPGTAAVALIVAASYLFEMMVWLVCPLVVVERSLGSLLLFGWGATAVHVGSFAGLLFGDWAQACWPDIAASGSLNVGLAAVLVLVMAYIFREQGVSDLFLPTEEPRPAEIDGGKVSSLCRGMAEEFGLTAREEQVLGLLAHGRSVPYIEQELGVSTSTAKTHVRHIYDKLGIHNKQELFDLFD